MSKSSVMERRDRDMRERERERESGLQWGEEAHTNTKFQGVGHKQPSSGLGHTVMVGQ